MEKLTLYKNKDEVFNCQLQIEGASIQDAQVRLLIELSNKNLLFYGTISEDGSCVIQIPRLTDLADTYGKVTIEAIVENMYFKIYEAEANLKNSVEVKMTKKESVKQEFSEPSIKMNKIIKETKDDKKVITERKNPYVVGTKIVSESIVEPESASEPAVSPYVAKFNEYIRNKANKNS